MFSRRVPASLDPTPLAVAVHQLRAAGTPFIDLTESNPTRVGLRYPDALLDALRDPRGYAYDPQPLGLLEARQAIAEEYARRGVGIDPSRVMLAASTSECYSFLFKLLCAPGDAVLVPQPSYPLFAYLTELDGIDGRPYHLARDAGWSFDVAAVADAIDDRTRAVLLVAPNNPTGTRIHRAALAELGAVCAARGIAVIGDEVFADYLLELDRGSDLAASVLDQSDALTFSLGGLSKSVGLPQLKLGWLAVNGPRHIVDDALARLEIVGDAYLSVSSPVQLATRSLLRKGASVRAQIADRVLLNYRVLVEMVATYPACRVPPVAGGWSAVVQAPAVMPDDLRALEILRDQGVLVHPGHLFDFERDGYFVVSLLPPSDDFRAGIGRVLGTLDRS